MKKEEIESLKAEIIPAFKDGQSCQAICKSLGLSCHPTTILNYLKLWGIDTSHKYKPESWGVNSEREALAQELKKQGKTHSEIADCLGVSRGRVNQILNHKINHG
jgi:hypothetical protein